MGTTIQSGRFGSTVTQVTFGEAGTGFDEAADGTAAVPYPANIVAGSFLILHIVLSDGASAPAVTTPAGWTLIQSIGTAEFVGSFSYYKIATGSESGTLSVTYTADTRCTARMYRFSHGSGVESSGSARSTGTGTTISCVNVTSTVDLAMAVQLMSAFGTTTIGNISGETGADYTEAAAEYSPGASSFLLSCQTAQLTTATAVTGGSATLGATKTDRHRHGFVIKP